MAHKKNITNISMVFIDIFSFFCFVLAISLPKVLQTNWIFFSLLKWMTVGLHKNFKKCWLFDSLNSFRWLTTPLKSVSHFISMTTILFVSRNLIITYEMCLKCGDFSSFVQNPFGPIGWIKKSKQTKWLL